MPISDTTVPILNTIVPIPTTPPKCQPTITALISMIPLIKAIDRVIGCSCTLVDYSVQSVSEGLDSIGTVTIRVDNAGRTFSGRGASTDIIVASAKAYLSAVNRMLAVDDESNLPAIGTTPD